MGAQAHGQTSPKLRQCPNFNAGARDPSMNNPDNPDIPQNPAPRPAMPGDVIRLPGVGSSILMAADLEALDLYETLAQRGDTAGVVALHRERRVRFIPNGRKACYLDAKSTPALHIPCVLVELLDGGLDGSRGWIPNVPQPASGPSDCPSDLQPNKPNNQPKQT